TIYTHISRPQPICSQHHHPVIRILSLIKEMKRKKMKMNKAGRRDDFCKNRLSSFLKTEGDLTVSDISFIKKNVFFMKTLDGEPLILKMHSKKAVVKQQWDFFSRLKTDVIIPFQKFPNGKKLLA